MSFAGPWGCSMSGESQWTWLTIADAVKDPHPPKPIPYPTPPKGL